MNKIELYLDREEKLTLEFFMNQDSEFSMSKSKGIQTYGIIREMCNKKIIDVKQNLRDNEITVIYDNCILHINEVSYALSKKGTAQLRDSISKYLEYKNRKEVEKTNSNINAGIHRPLKVTRKNKHVGLKIVAAGLTLLYIGAVIASNIPENKNDNIPYTETTSYTEFIETTGPTDSILEKSDLTFVQDIVDIEDDCINIPITYEDNSQTEKARIAKAYYYSTIEKYAKRYGLDPKLVMGIATQERGIHSETMDSGGATGLMQIQNSVWVGKELTAYNYEEGKYDTVKITKEDLSDVFKNIRYGCMIFQNCIKQMDSNMIAAIQCYNMGYGNMMKIFNSYSCECGKSIEEILADFEDYGWLEHRDIIRVGDQKYLEHVFSWIGPEIDIGASDLRGTAVNLKVTNQSESKNISIN